MYIYVCAYICFIKKHAIKLSANNNRISILCIKFIHFNGIYIQTDKKLHPLHTKVIIILSFKLALITKS